MVIWQPEKGTELGNLYDACMRMGAPRFLSPVEMQSWIERNWNDVKNYVRNTYHITLKPTDDVLSYLLFVFQKIYAHAKGNELFEELKRLAVKALRKPLLLNPHTLHPIDATTQMISGLSV